MMHGSRDLLDEFLLGETGSSALVPASSTHAWLLLGLQEDFNQSTSATLTTATDATIEPHV